jgi:hypothetical protein
MGMKTTKNFNECSLCTLSRSPNAVPLLIISSAYLQVIILILLDINQILVFTFYNFVSPRRKESSR